MVVAFPTNTPLQLKSQGQWVCGICCVPHDSKYQFDVTHQSCKMSLANQIAWREAKLNYPWQQSDDRSSSSAKQCAIPQCRGQ